jgi:hypothetical protein
MGNSVIRPDGSIIWSAEWLGSTSSTTQGLDDDLFSVYRTWYEGHARGENEHDFIPLQLAS